MRDSDLMHADSYLLRDFTCPRAAVPVTLRMTRDTRFTIVYGTPVRAALEARAAAGEPDIFQKLEQVRLWAGNAVCAPRTCS